MSFILDIAKQAREIFFSRKKSDTSHPSLYFNNTQIQLHSVQKHLGLFIDEKFSFLEHIDKKNKESNSRG